MGGDRSLAAVRFIDQRVLRSAKTAFGDHQEFIPQTQKPFESLDSISSSISMSPLFAQGIVGAGSRASGYPTRWVRNPRIARPSSRGAQSALEDGGCAQKNKNKKGRRGGAVKSGIFGV